MSQTTRNIFHAADVSYVLGKLRPALPQKNLWTRNVTPDILEIQRGSEVMTAEPDE
jgi:hypothetical protein